MTSTDKIPEDVIKAAAAFSICHKEPAGCVHVDEQSCADGCEILAAIARAIMAERERAAKIVETFYLSPEPTSRAARYHLKHCVRPVFASAIRGGR